MPDKEKVIKGLEYCIKDIECTGCPYEQKCFDADDDRQFGEDMMRDALELLKEQEQTIERLEHDLAITENNINYYINGND